MVQLSELSRIGFGCHFVSVNVPEHHEAMTYALRSGCNLFDTSANYMHGESELLIGKVLQENPRYDSFVVTKSGYDESEDLDAGLTSDLLHPDFLATRLALSRVRLQRATIDAFLLHSPEAYLNPDGTSLSKDDFYGKVERAFGFLENQVTVGTVRYYGVSSNTFHLPVTNPDTIDVRRLLAIARKVSFDHHFRFIEFPFNLDERGASEPHHGGSSLLTLARANGLVTIGNRPLNANTPDGPVRLALYAGWKQGDDDTDAEGVFQECLALMRKQLRKRGLAEDPTEYAIIGYLHHSRDTIQTPDAVTELFDRYLHPFLAQLYDREIPADDLAVYVRFYEASAAGARRLMTKRTLAFYEALIEAGTVTRNDSRPLPLVACGTYFDAGIDHVVVGMRKRDYVDMLKPLFGR